MFYRAGLVALIFTLITLPVSAVPIPISTPASLSESSTLSSGSNRSGRILATIPLNRLSATARAHTDNKTPIDGENQLVRRNARLNAKIRAGFRKAGRAIANVAKKVKTGIVTAAKKVGTFMQHTGSKIAKFGTMVYSTVTQAASKVAGFIPGVGKPIGKALAGVSKAAGAISNKIHANLSPKLQKGMKVMRTANKQRDIGDHDISLEYREESYFDAEVRDNYEQYVDWE